MSNVQAVIAALNQQSNSTKDSQVGLNRRSKPGPDMASLRSQFGTASMDKPPKRSSQVEIKPTSFRQRGSFPIDATKASLIEQLEKVTQERDNLKQQLDGRMIDITPESLACASLTKKETSTLPPGPSSYCWFDINDIDSGNPSDHQEEIDDYNRKLSAQNQINSLEQQLTACDIGTQWMMNKYIGELEQNRLYTNLLVSIVKNQEKLINAMNDSKPTSLSSSEQQIILLQSQLELQRMELDDKEDLVIIMAEERDILLQKLKQLTHQLLYNTPIEGEGRHRNHPRSSSSSSSMSSCSSLSTLSLIDWPNNNTQNYYNQSTPLKSPSSRSPKTPPPKQKLPLLPSSPSWSTTTSDLSPRNTLILTPSTGSPILSSPDYQGSLSHKSSIPDMRPLDDYQPNLAYERKTLGRQKSFWKDWKNRLSA